MLPSTGYFKGINCPFYDSGLCERPYCHFRHGRKESQNTSNDGIESGAILQKLVSAALQKVLQQTERTSTSSAQLTASDNVDVSNVNNSQPVSKATYNPTPISELNKINNVVPENIQETIEQRKRHIPVPYTPRKPASISIKRPVETNGASKPFIYIPPSVKYTPGCAEVVLDPYTPKGSLELNDKYLPGNEIQLQEYTPKETQSSNKRNYVPSEKIGSNKKKILEYEPAKVTPKNETSSVVYQPTLRSLAPCFSSDDEETDPKKIKLSSDSLNGLDDLGAEFDILDQILDEEKSENIPENQEIKFEPLKTTERKDSKENNNKCDDYNKKDKCAFDKKETKKVHEKTKFDDKSKSDKSKSSDMSQSNDKSKSDKSKSDKSKSDKLKSDKSKSDKSKSDKSKSDKSKSDKSKSDVSKSDKPKSDKSSSDKLKYDKSKHVKKEKSLSNKDKTDEKSKSYDKKSHKSSNKAVEKETSSDKKTTDSKKHSSSKSSGQSSRHPDSKVLKGTEKHSKYCSSSKKGSTSNVKIKKTYEDSQAKCKNQKEQEQQTSYINSTDSDHHNDDNGELHQSDEEVYDMSESDEETRALECKRIFEEYVPQEHTNKYSEVEHTQLGDASDNEYIPAKKRISRTTGKEIKILPKAPIKPNYKVSAAQAMAERLGKIREFHVSKSFNDTSNTGTSMQDLTKNTFITSNTGNSKIRIAHVPYASTLMNAKKSITSAPNLNRKDEPSSSSTVVQTVKKGTQRMAHIPNEKFIDRPGALEPLGSKIPANIRSTYLNMMIDECLKIYLSAVDAYARAQHEELATSKKCSTVQIYKNSAVLTVSRLRKEFQECNGVKKSGSECAALQKMPQTVTGKAGNMGSWSIESKNRRIVDHFQEFSGAKFYNNINKWVLTEEQLLDNGFPRPHHSGEKGRAIIYGQNKQKPPKGNFRTCCRCKKDYTVDKKGFPAAKEECIYHPNNKYRVRGEARYQCCSQDATSDGCCVAPSHVYEYVDFENLKGYVRTLPPETVTDDYGVYSLDCEMCYTTHGLDLTRVTVINSACKVVYETLVRPLHPIIDYNTRYSGITEEQMAEVKTTLLEVQATLLAMFNSKTILIGHSLESDFKALKLIHDTVIDTSVLFPHKMGPPFKRALRNLCSEYLKKIIQNSVDGHDSAEDATVCMELIIYKLKEDLKTR